MSEHPSAEIQRTDLPRLRAIPGGLDEREEEPRQPLLHQPDALRREVAGPLRSEIAGPVRSEAAAPLRRDVGAPLSREAAEPLVPQAPRPLRPVPGRGRQSPGDRKPVREPLWREALGQRLRSMRQEQGETLVETAGRAGVSPQYLSEVERGRKEPSSEMIAAMAGALGTSLGGLIQQVADDLVRHRQVSVGRSAMPQMTTAPTVLLLAA